MGLVYTPRVIERTSLVRSKVAPPLGFALSAKGFRPFFLGAAAFAGVALPAWIAVLSGASLPKGYLDPVSWHAHEMLFGFTIAVIAGFLLTAVGNWTQRETVVGPPLLALAGLWAAGRAAVMFAPLLPRGVPLAIDGAFMPILAVVLARPLVATRNRKNLVMVALVSALAGASIAMHADALGWLPGAAPRAARVGLDLVTVMVSVIAGRVFPMFTRNATGDQAIRTIPALDRVTLAGLALLVVLDAAGASRIAAVVAGLVAITAAARTARWGAGRSSREPLLWVLHLGHAWIPIGLALRALSALTPAIPASLGTHALTAGAIGTLTLGMMARVALGHTGRILAAPRSATGAFVLVTIGAVVRVASPVLGPAAYVRALSIAGTAWALAFVLFLVGYATILLAPRADGKPG